MNSTTHSARLTVVFVLGFALLCTVAATSLMLGAFIISPGEVVAWLTGTGDAEGSEAAVRVLSSIRLPRVVAAAIAGAALGAVGTVLQGVYRTSLGDPHLLGLSSAAGLGAAVGYVFTPPSQIPIAPFLLAGLAAAVFAVVSGGLRSLMGSDRFVLAGVAFGFALLAWTGMFVSVVNSARIPTLGFFIFGSLAGATWKAVVAALILFIPSMGLLWTYGPGIDLLALGDRDARSLGFDTRRLIPVVVAAAGIATAASVGLAGVVGFVGLLAPFVLRPIVGPGHRTLMPAAAIGGAIALVVADTVARIVVAPTEIPLGLVTAAIGGPFLAWLLVRRSTR